MNGINVFNLLDEQFNTDLTGLEQTYQSELGHLDKPLLDQKRSLQRQYDIKADYLERQYLTDEDFVGQLTNLNRQLELGAAKLEDKEGPTREKLLTSYHGDKSQLLQKYSQNKIRIQQIQDLVDAGHLSSDVGTQQQLNIIGINVPLTELKPLSLPEQLKDLQNFEQQLADIEKNYFVVQTKWGKPELKYAPGGDAQYKDAELVEITPDIKQGWQDLKMRRTATQGAILDILGLVEPQRAIVQRKARRLTGAIVQQSLGFKNEVEKSKQQILRKYRGFGGLGPGPAFAVPVTPSRLKQPSAQELRRKGTREAYEEGRKLGYWQ